MTRPDLTDVEVRLLRCLLSFYREIGPGATPAMKGLDGDAGIERWELEEAVKGLREKEYIEYWPLQPAVRLTSEGLLAAEALPPLPEEE